MLLFHLICLFVSLSGVEAFILSGTYSKRHRLLPLILGIVSVYNFYLVIETAFGVSMGLDVLKDLLLVQLLSVMLYYVFEIMDLSMNKWQQIAVFSADFLLSVLMVLRAGKNEGIANSITLIFIALFLGILTFAIVMALIRRTYSHKAQKLYRRLLIALLVPTVTTLFSFGGYFSKEVGIPISILVSEAIVVYLIITDKLLDTEAVMKGDVFGSVGIATALFDADMFFIDANSSMKQIFSDEIKEASEHPDSYSFKGLLMGYLDSGAEEHEIEYKDGHIYRAGIRKVYYRNRLWGYMAACVDITNERQKAENAIEETKLKSNFLAHMSHELRSPLHAIIGGSEIVLERDDCSERSRNLVSHIHNAGTHLLDIVNSILDYSKLEGGRLTLNEYEYNLYALLQEQAGNIMLNLKDKNVRFSLTCNSDCPRLLLGDEARVREILQNLLSNAAKFTENGYIKAALDFEYGEGSIVKITYSVSDTGYGMTEEQMATVFGEYVSYSGPKITEGTGLGLAIVKQLAEMMNGAVSVQSKVGEGTTFTVSFCQKTVNDEVIPAFTMDENSLNSSDIRAISMDGPTAVYPDANVLVVDDMEVNRHIFRELVADWEFKVDTADSGAAALEKLREKTYDLIFLDQMMPVMSGVETAQKIRAELPERAGIPMIMMTADITDEMRQLSAKTGFTDYLAKPVNMAQLKKVIEELLPSEKAHPVVNYAGIGAKEPSLFVVESYYEELMEMAETIEEIFKSDIELFRTRVHGLKGISRQLGKERLGDRSEIMEMAAKSGHQPFIEKKLPGYISDINLTAEKVKLEIEERKRR